MIESILFWIFAIIAVSCAFGVVFHPNPIKSALFLVLAFFSLGGIYILLMAHFIAIVHIAVYAGAIMVLFLFVIMLLNVQIEARVVGGGGLMKYAGYALAVLFIQLTILGFRESFHMGYVNETNIGTVKNIGMALFSKYVLPFEVASLLLLVAMIGATYLSKRYLAAGGESGGHRSMSEMPPKGRDETDGILKKETIIEGH